MADNEIRLPLDIPGYAEAMRKVKELIATIRKLEAQRERLIATDKRLIGTYEEGSRQMDTQIRQAKKFYKALDALAIKYADVRAAHEAWLEALKKAGKEYRSAMMQEDEIQRLHSMSWRLEDAAGLGLQFKGLRSKKPYPRWGGIPKPEASRMRDLAGAANAGFWSQEFTKGMNKATRATAKHKSAADQNSRALSIEARRFKWMLGFALMGVNALKKLTGESKIFSAMWSLLGKALGFVIDMIILPLAPVLVWIAKALFWVGGFIKDINDAAKKAGPEVGILVSLFEILTGVAILAGLYKLITGINLIEAFAAAAGIKVSWLYGLIKGLAVVWVAMIVLKIADDTGVANFMAKTYWVALNFLKGMYWSYMDWIAKAFESQFAWILEFRDMIINAAKEIRAILFGEEPGFGGGGVGGRRGDGSTNQRYSYIGGPNPYLTELGLAGYDPSMGDWWPLIDKRWEEKYPGGWTTFGDQFDSFGYTGRSGAAQMNIDQSTNIGTVNLTADLDSIDALADEAIEKALARRERTVARYYTH